MKKNLPNIKNIVILIMPKKMNVSTKKENIMNNKSLKNNHMASVASNGVSSRL